VRKLLLALNEELRLTVSENRVLRNRLRPKRGEVIGEWRKLHNEELTDLYSSPNIIRVMKSTRIRWAGHVACNGERRGAYGVLVGRSERRMSLWKPRRS
jgi:hypothetical protein